MTTNKALTIGAVAFAGFAFWAYMRGTKGVRAPEQAVSGSAPGTFGAGWFLGPDPKESAVDVQYTITDEGFNLLQAGA